MPRFDDARGRYIYLTIDGTEYRVYFEENGAGVPLLLQHTAGADGRQWRHLLNDAEVATRFRMVAYDLPYHGKSVPPERKEWWREEYRLTKDFLMKVPVALSRELGLERPVFMGSSIGGHLAVDLALHYPDAFRAVVGLEAALATPGAYLDQWYHPRISNDFKASVMYGLMSPTSPEAYRRETAWVYSQGAPPVFKGDLYYYAVDHDLTETARQIDTAKVAVYILTGEYDTASPPALGQALAERIPGATFQTMEKLGHFPMSEDPARFKSYVWPVLQEIAGRA
ncbi:MAG: alpha/beta hydrolase [Dehalococcoidia bacterium]